MFLKNLVKSYSPAWIRNLLLKIYSQMHKHESIERFKFKNEKEQSARNDIQEKYGHNSDLLMLFTKNKDFVVHKWHHYIPIYDRYFSPYRGKKIRFLEIGVSKGGSLQMWRKYFGEDAIIYGIDINPDCLKFNGLAGQVRIGSQIDKVFLEEVINEMGGVDIILDDGSHQMEHIPITLKYLYPHLNYNGIYLIEDLHTAYWNSFGGGFHAKKNFFVFIMKLVNDMHRWYHMKKVNYPKISDDCSGIHIHDSIVILEKNKTFQPVHSENS